MIEARLLRVAFWSGLVHTLTAAAQLASTVRVRSFVCQLTLRRWESLRRSVSEQARAANASVVVFFSEEGRMGCVGSLWLL